ncbi:MAG: 4-(cytidine 5'-diphospho)-2-C-methyl-D-erythritol kinase [Verrucomicrobiota bacterium JB022]|nr:4-(cytidine 5'-diphospho)-2-C-methyl-D-erythritol kinase [Verrucomicrobiota bacterium JB022]
MSTVVWQRRVTCPAKLNLGLWVLGKRADGFHALESLVVQTEWGDELELCLHDEPGDDSLTCDVSELPTDSSNLVMKAVRLFRERHGIKGRAAFSLTKRIPWGGGLGGGSADGAWALRLLNEAHGHPLSPDQLLELAAQLGSDVPLFLHDEPVWMRGRGEVIETVSPELVARLSGLYVTVAHPGFPVETPWAYKHLAAQRAYSPVELAQAGREAWAQPGLPPHSALHNDFRAVVDAKYPTVPLVLAQLNAVDGVRAQMSGSGSACVALYEAVEAQDAVANVLREAWGEQACVVQTRLR